MEKKRKLYPIEYVIAPQIGKTWLNLFYDYCRWNQPIRYIEVDLENIVQVHFFGPLKLEVVDYFFDICINDGREKISFTSSLGAFQFTKMIHQNMRHLEPVSSLETDCSKDNFAKLIIEKTSRMD